MAVNVFTELAPKDVLFLGEAALRTLQISCVSILAGSLFGVLFGWMMAAGNKLVAFIVNALLDIFRSVPLIIQLILFDSFISILGFPLPAFVSGTIVLSIYTAAVVAHVARGGLEGVPIG